MKMMKLVEINNKNRNVDFNQKNNMENKNIEILYNMWAEKAQHLTGCHTPCGGYSEFERLKLLINLI